MRNGLYFGTDIHLTGYKRVKTRERIGCKTDCFKMDFNQIKRNEIHYNLVFHKWRFKRVVRVEGEYRGLTRLSLKSRPGLLTSVPYHMKLFNKFITTYRYYYEPKVLNAF